MLKAVIVLVLEVAQMNCPQLQAQQIPDAVVADPPAEKHHPPGLVMFTVPSHGMDLDVLWFAKTRSCGHQA